MFKIFGKYYYIDFNKLVSFFSELKTSEKEKTSIITMNYAGDEDAYINKDMSLQSKEMVESKSNFNSTLQTAKYETVKFFIEALLNTYYDKEGSFLSGLNAEEIPLPQRLAFNSLIKAGILVEEENYN